MKPLQQSAWDSFWRETSEKAAYAQQSPLESALARFWTKLFIEDIPQYPRLRLVDLACGNGVVTQFVQDAIAHLGERPYSLHCLDHSPGAIAALTRRFPLISGVVADAKRTPFDDRRFDIVVSQYGLEYAGIEAFAEAARLVAAHGRLAAIVHLKNGAIYRENVANKSAVTKVRQADVMGGFGEYVEAHFDLRQRRGSPERLQLADQRLAFAVKDLEQVLNAFSLNVAGGALYRLHSDLAHMYGRLEAYRLEDLRAWIENNTAELAHYSERMSSMLGAALDAEGLAAAIGEIEQRGVSIIRQDALMVGNEPVPVAWTLVGKRE